MIDETMTCAIASTCYDDGNGATPRVGSLLHSIIGFDLLEITFICELLNSGMGRIGGQLTEPVPSRGVDRALTVVHFPSSLEFKENHCAISGTEIAELCLFLHDE